MKRIHGLRPNVGNRFYTKNSVSYGPYKYEMVKKNGRCVFLSGKKCTIYENRPLICRFYPFTMFRDDEYVFEADQDCQGIGIGEVVDERYLRELVQLTQGIMVGNPYRNYLIPCRECGE